MSRSTVCMQTSTVLSTSGCGVEWMYMRLWALVGLALALISPSSAESMVYYCTSELATGITQDKQTEQWQTSGFKQVRFMLEGDFSAADVRAQVSMQGHKWQFKCDRTLGSGAPKFFTCTCVDFENSGTAWPSVFVINLELMRYEYSHMSVASYARPLGDNSSLHAGTCETF